MKYNFNIRIWSPIVSGNARKQLASLQYACENEAQAQEQAERLRALVQGEIGKVEITMPWSDQWAKGRAEGKFKTKWERERENRRLGLVK